jgi:hypothetical protein
VREREASVQQCFLVFTAIIVVEKMRTVFELRMCKTSDGTISSSHKA